MTEQGDVWVSGSSRNLCPRQPGAGSADVREQPEQPGGWERSFEEKLQ